MLKLRHVFTLANSSRSETPVVLIRIDSDGLSGYGEASLPPYLGATQESVMAFLSKVDLNRFSLDDSLTDILDYIAHIEPGNTAAKAALDIALHDLYGKSQNQPLWKRWNLSPQETTPTSFTIGIDSAEGIRNKVREAADFKILKVKLGSDCDKMIIETIREISDVPLYVDANQGWSDPHFALDMLHWLAERNVVMAEQPMPVDRLDETAWLTSRSPIPVIADESFQRYDDFAKIKDAFSGVNIKLMKCTGLHEARRIISAAREADLKIMLGCMAETSCAMAAAVQIASLVDYVDLDGHLLITNDAFSGLRLSDGKVLPSDLPGLGVIPVNDIFND